MNKTTNGFFIGDTPKGSVIALPEKAGGELSRGILQRIAIANETFEQATARLIRLADLAYGARDYDGLQELSGALAAIPFTVAQRAAATIKRFWRSAPVSSTRQPH